MGTELPVLEVEPAYRTADEVARGVLAAGCLTGRVTATEGDALAWARAALKASGRSPRLPLTAKLEAEFHAPSGLFRLRAPMGERNVPLADQPISWDAAATLAKGVLDDARQRGLLSDFPHELARVTHNGGSDDCEQETPTCRAEVRAHRFWFWPTHAGVPMPSAAAELVIRSDGTVGALMLRPLHARLKGKRVAALSEAAAEARLREIVEQPFDTDPPHWSVPGRLEYVVPAEAGPVDVEPIWWSRIVPGGGRPTEVSVALTGAPGLTLE